MKRFTLFLLVFSMLLSSFGVMPAFAEKGEFPFTDIAQTTTSGYFNVKALWEKGYRYRKNYKKLPGNPDIVLTKYKIAIFCDGESAVTSFGCSLS